MFFRRRKTIIAEGLKIKGNISAEGLVEVDGHIEGEVRCRFLFVSPKAVINGGIEAERVAVNGRDRRAHSRQRGRAQVARACCRRYPTPASLHRARGLFRGALSALA